MRQRTRRTKLDARSVARIAAAWIQFSQAWLDDGFWRRLLEKLETNDVAGAIESVPDLEASDPATFKPAFKILMDALGDVFEANANREYQRVGSNIRATVKKAKRPNRFAETPHSDAFIRGRAARLVVEITNEQRRSIRESIARRWNPNTRPESLVREIKSTVGLNSRLATALQNRIATMQAAGAKPSVVQREAKKYGDQLLRYRAQMIARTETVAVESNAKQVAWEVGVEDGTIERGAKKEWVANVNACPDCEELDGQKVAIDQPFYSRKFGRIDSTPAHPQCECEVELA